MQGFKSDTQSNKYDGIDLLYMQILAVMLELPHLELRKAENIQFIQPPVLCAREPLTVKALRLGNMQSPVSSWRCTPRRVRVMFPHYTHLFLNICLMESNPSALL
jgi:hypothetical protein